MRESFNAINCLLYVEGLLLLNVSHARAVCSWLGDLPAVCSTPYDAT